MPDYHQHKENVSGRGRQSAEDLLFVCHILGLYLHTQTTRHGHITAQFERCSAENSMIGHCRNMTSHGYGRIEIGCAPLHVYALQSICIVAYPELIEVGQQTIVGPASPRCTVLDDNIGIFGPDALACFDEPLMVGYVKMTLFLEILRAVIHDGCIGIPFDICYLGE